MKRKILTFIIFMCIVLSIAGCNDAEISSNEDKSSSSTQLSLNQNELSIATQTTLLSTKKKSTTQKLLTPISNLGLNERLTAKNEETIYSVKISQNNSYATISRAKDNNYLVFRYGTKNNLISAFPQYKEDSWAQFGVSWYLRGGGAENAGTDLNYLSFNDEHYSYCLFSQYDAIENQHDFGLTVKNKSNKNEDILLGNAETVVGSMIELRSYDKKLKNGTGTNWIKVR